MVVALAVVWGGDGGNWWVALAVVLGGAGGFEW